MNHNILPYIPYTRYLLRQTSGSAAARVPWEPAVAAWKARFGAICLRPK